MKVNSLRLEGKAIQCAFPFQFYFNNRKRLLHHKKTKPRVGIDELRGFRPHLQYNTTEGVEKQCKYHYLHQGGHGFSVYTMARRILKEF